MNLNALINVLQSEGNLKHAFTEIELEQLASHISIESIENGAYVIRKGQPADSMVFIIDGLVQVLDDGRQIALQKAGGFVGESLFSDEAIRMADAQAIESTTIGRFTIHDFDRFLHDNQRLALRFREYFQTVGRARAQQIANENYVDNRKYLALIAHNNMKEGLMEFCAIQSEKLNQFPLIATGTTGSMLYKKTGLCLSRKVASGPLGGDQAVGTLISTRNICGVIFFRDPLSAHPHHADIEALGRLCDVYQIPFATNPQSSEAILDYLLSGKAERELIPNHVLEAYVQGQNKVVETG